MGTKLRDTASLEHVVGSRPLAALLKSIDFLDDHCEALLALSRVAVVGYWDRDGLPCADVVGGDAGFARPLGPRRLKLNTPRDVRPGTPFSTLFLIRGWREALRINGRIDKEDAGCVHVDEAFVHCGKAVIRAELWAPSPTPHAGDPSDAGESLSDPAVRAFLDACRYVTISSCDAEGRADTSPKGDPAGFIRVLDGETIAIPDRPGNRRTDTMHNLVVAPGAALVCLNPGDARTLRLSGEAHVSCDPALLRTMAVRGKVPKAALVVRVTRCRLAHAAALETSGLWDASTAIRPDDVPRAETIWSDHVRANRTKGVAAAAIRAGARGALVSVGTEVDYKTRLY